MKLRFRKNSLRLRVNQREVENLASGKALEERIEFPGDASISYVLETTERSSPEASFRQGVIRVSAPHAQVHDWARGDSIGMYFELPANGTPLKVAVEKDLECVDGPPEERDPDAFPRSPRKNC
jgi:hypothetical protein